MPESVKLLQDKWDLGSQFEGPFLLTKGEPSKFPECTLEEQGKGNLKRAQGYTWIELQAEIPCETTILKIWLKELE